ncbi:MAG: hypothetical protein HPM95_11440 [Alphaproteobacteria bacterium]|nr:hypothetical protein [Alphaproteobacteria bacterium]
MPGLARLFEGFHASRLSSLVTARERQARRYVNGYLLSLDDATLAAYGYDRAELERQGSATRHSDTRTVLEAVRRKPGHMAGFLLPGFPGAICQGSWRPRISVSVSQPSRSCRRAR